MSEIEQRAVNALLRVKMPQHGWHRGFRVFLLERLRTSPREKLLAKQAADLWFLVWNYRRQIDDGAVVARADEIINGAFRLALS